MDEYVIWDYTKPGISFNIVSGRITVFKATLEAMHYPEYFHFLFSPEDLIFGVEPCHLDDGGSHRLPEELTREHFDIKCKDLVRLVYRPCGWGKKLTYRIPGIRYSDDSGLVCFNLRQAYEIHEGRMKEAKKAKEA